LAAHHPLVSTGATGRVSLGRRSRFPARGRERLPEPVGENALLVVTSTTNPDSPHLNLDRRLLTAAEVAALLAIPRSSVYEYARRRVNPLPSLLIGRHRRFERHCVERWVSLQAA
jgi:excisionase family DNA binding protein